MKVITVRRFILFIPLLLTKGARKRQVIVIRIELAILITILFRWPVLSEMVQK